MNNGTELQRRAFLLAWIPFPHRPETELAGVEFRVHRSGFGGFSRSPHRFLVIHGDEDTARDVLETWMFDHPGTAYLVTGKTRNVEISGLKIDPNRMFSRAGAELSLRARNPGLDVEKMIAVLDTLDRERPRLLKHLIPPRGGRLFALHNNRDYSVHDELAASDRTSIKEPSLPRSFFLCTNSADFDILSQSPFNVVLQSAPNPDDGSLSRLAARVGFRYINLECAIGDYEGQLRRVSWLEDRLR